MALVVPVAVFLFLKTFGRNEFEVQPLFIDVVPERPSFCPLMDIQVPYHLPPAVQARFHLSGKNQLILYYIGQPDNLLIQRLRNSFSKEELNWFIITPDTLKRIPAENCILMPDDSISFYRLCYLFLPEQKNIVLVDSLARIRGYYGSSREEVDKLLMEASIILKKY